MTDERGRAEFRIDRQGERVEALAFGIDPGHLRRLRRGEIEAEREIDLHGLDRRNARFLVRAELRDAHSHGQRCVRVIHGRGLRSEAGAVLRDELPGWLAELPLGALVMAFASAPAAQGGAGATLVLLRRRRPAGG